MSELEDKINSILGDPKQMEMISGLAKNLMGQSEQPQDAGLPDGIDPEMLGRIGRLLRTDSGGRSGAVLEAMKPYLSEKRRGKVDRAIKLTRIARIARLAMGENGGEGDV